VVGHPRLLGRPRRDSNRGPLGGWDIDETVLYQSSTTYDHGGRPTEMTLPCDPDWATLGGTGAAPVVKGAIEYNRRGLPASITAHIDGTAQPIITNLTYAADRQVTQVTYGDGSVGRAPTVTDTAYDVRGRPVQSVTQREPFTDGSLEDDIDRPVHEQYTWDGANNLTQVLDLRDPGTLGSGILPPRRKIHHDALYRVIGVALDYRQGDGTWGDDVATDWRDQRTRPNNDAQTHEEADPMRERPAPMVPHMPASRVKDLTYSYDWLANMVDWYDDESVFYERSIGRIDNGFDEAGFPFIFGDPTQYKRPSALYLATNISDSPPSSYDGNADRGGWVWLDYGEGGNVEAMTVRARCADEAEQNRCYDDASLPSFDNRNEHLRTACRCDKEQHYQYRWDEVNRLAEARRYDRGGSGDWQLAVRQRYRYDGNNQRTVKQTLDANPALGDPPERVALYIQPGNFERRGLTTDYINVGYAADPILGTETQYQVGGSRIVWKTHDAPTTPGQPERTHRVTYALTDLIQSTSAVIDLHSGAMLEVSTFYPNGAQETHFTTPRTSMAPEPLGFTGKEADEEVGVTYFGERYLIPRIGRWASPDPLSIHAAEGGEVGNAYHYVAGNLLQARDPLGLEAEEQSGAAKEATKEVAEALPDVMDEIGRAAQERAEEFAQEALDLAEKAIEDGGGEFVYQRRFRIEKDIGAVNFQGFGAITVKVTRDGDGNLRARVGATGGVRIKGPPVPALAGGRVAGSLSFTATGGARRENGEITKVDLDVSASARLGVRWETPEVSRFGVRAKAFGETGVRGKLAWNSEDGMRGARIDLFARIVGETAIGEKKDGPMGTKKSQVHRLEFNSMWELFRWGELTEQPLEHTLD
jgi:RHS repeat-associated protein